MSEIDTSLSCVSPRLSAQARAEEAVTLLAHDLVYLTDGLKGGAELNDRLRTNLRAIAEKIGRIAC